MQELSKRKLEIPELCLVVLIGASGSGKSSFARKHFLPTEVVSSDACRGIVCDDEGSLEASRDAFELVHYIANTRLRRGKLTVIDATNVRAEDRAQLVAIAREHDVFAAAIVLATPEEVCWERNQQRPDRQFGRHVVRKHCVNVRQSLRTLERERFRFVHVLRSQEEVDAVEIVRTKAWSDRRDDRGPFDVIGDVHGCHDELLQLLAKLGYDVSSPDRVVAPMGRKAVFVGDLTDRGPKPVEVLRLVRTMVQQGTALCVAGNHDVKLLRALNGRNVKMAHGLEQTMNAIAQTPPEEREAIRAFLDSLISHYQLDGGDLVVAHAGMKERYIGRTSGRVREFALYGDTTGEVDDDGLPVRLDWAADYRGRSAIVYGHTVVEQVQWFNNTVCIDSGCCFGGSLTALRWPERELVSVKALQTYVENPRKRAATPAGSLTMQQAYDQTLDLADVMGKRVVDTELGGKVTIREENAAAALEVVSRFAADPRWLVYLPPTMSPCATSDLDGYLEHPAEAFDYFASEGVETVVCEEKHMGSRAVVVVGRDERSIVDRFGIDGDGAGAILTRTGRRFFEDRSVETALLDRLRSAIVRAGLWDELSTSWMILDCELMPWGAKAQDLVAKQYAAVGSAARATLAAGSPLLAQAAKRHPELAALAAEHEGRARAADLFVQSYQRYCWDVKTIDDYRIAPFHLLASEGAAHVDRDHLWHMQALARLATDVTIIATPYRAVALADDTQRADAIAWWADLTSRGGEGMVVKPLQFVTRNASKGHLVQPAVKCRGPEYLRIIYGPEYLRPANLTRLRQRGLGAKRALALREFALGVEGLQRFVRREPLRRVHECAFAVLALESEPIDPRL